MKKETEKLVEEVTLGAGIGVLFAAAVAVLVMFGMPAGKPAGKPAAKVQKPKVTVIEVTKTAAPAPRAVAPAVVPPEPMPAYVPRRAPGVSDELLWGIAMKETGGNNGLVGDRHLRYKAYWLLQIRKPYLDDVNRKIVGRRRMRELWGKPALTLADMKDPDKAMWVARTYLEYYGKAYHRETGRSPTNEVYARMHNGGPDGWRERETYKYWLGVRREMSRMGGES